MTNMYMYRHCFNSTFLYSFCCLNSIIKQIRDNTAQIKIFHPGSHIGIYTHFHLQTFFFSRRSLQDIDDHRFVVVPKRKVC